MYIHLVRLLCSLGFLWSSSFFYYGHKFNSAFTLTPWPRVDLRHSVEQFSSNALVWAYSYSPFGLSGLLFSDTQPSHVHKACVGLYHCSWYLSLARAKHLNSHCITNCCVPWGSKYIVCCRKVYRGHEERRLQYIGQLFCGDGWRGGGWMGQFGGGKKSPLLVELLRTGFLLLGNWTRGINNLKLQTIVPRYFDELPCAAADASQSVGNFRATRYSSGKPEIIEIIQRV